jgi:hypothetical protein
MLETSSSYFLDTRRNLISEDEHLQWRWRIFGALGYLIIRYEEVASLLKWVYSWTFLGVRILPRSHSVILKQNIPQQVL